MIDCLHSIGEAPMHALYDGTTFRHNAHDDHLGHDRDHVERLLGGALETGAPGVNVLLYGPPGTGKTELCKVLAGRLGVDLHSVRESDEDGDEPSRNERLQELRLAPKTLRDQVIREYTPQREAARAPARPAPDCPGPPLAPPLR